MRPGRTETALFLMCWIAFGYFHQGGGWGQNARFAMVRAIVEEGTCSIDDYLLYFAKPSPDGATDLVRVPVRDGEFQWQGRSCVLSWTDRKLTGFAPVAGRYSPGQLIVSVASVAVSGDVTFRRDHFYPNKAPGTSFLAVPAYFILYHLERAAGLDVDHWKMVTINAWLTGALSIGLVCALGCVVFFRMVLLLGDGNELAGMLTTFGLAFGTLFFPYATMLQDHSVFATALLVSFWLLYQAKLAAASGRRAGLLTWWSGVCLGAGCSMNYLGLIVAVVFLAYLACSVRDKRAWLWFGLGMLGPVLVIGAYHLACFGTPFTNSMSELNPAIRSQDAFLNVFRGPRWDVLLALLFSPFRGLFFSCPVACLGVVGLWQMIRTNRRRTEAWLFMAVALVFLMFNVCYVIWTGGWSTGPRYLTPALPFLMAPAVVVFSRFFRTASLVLMLSVAATLVVTAVDPQSPLGDSYYGQVPGRPVWTYNQLTEYEGPLFLTGQAGPILKDKVEEIVRGFDQDLTAKGYAADVRQAATDALRHRLLEDVAAGRSTFFSPSTTSLDKTPLALANVRGPVSANPIGIYEGGYAFVFPLDSPQARGNSFNAGEFLFPGSRLSLLPLLVCCGGLAVWILLGLVQRSNELRRGPVCGT